MDVCLVYIEDSSRAPMSYEMERPVHKRDEFKQMHLMRRDH
jgi:hypothetical protein